MIDNFFTIQTSQGGTVKNGIGSPAGMPVSIQGLNFIDLILARILEQRTLESQDANPDAPASPSTPDTALQSENPLLDKETKLDIAALIAAHPEIQEKIREQLGLETGDIQTQITQAQLIEALDLNQKAFDDALKPLTGGIITFENVEKGSPRLLQSLMIDTESRKSINGKLQLILNKLENLLEKPENGLLTVANITPEQITELKEKITDFLAASPEGQPVPSEEIEKQDEELKGIILGLIKILPPQAQPEIIILPQALVITPRPLDVKFTGPAPKASAPANDLKASLNPLISDEPSPLPAAPAPAQNGAPEGYEFEKILGEFAGKKAEFKPEIVTGDNTPKSNTPQIKPDSSILQNWPFAWPGTFSAHTDETAYGLSPASLTITGPAALTNSVTHSPSAALPHPGTQMVAATIQKAANDGENRNILLQLEPPELGRVEVRMSFGKDKTVKAVVLAERGETLGMLQRDAHVLERALIDAGLDSSNNSLSFELAQDDHFSGGGHEGSGGGAHKDTENEELIQSTMTWFVDSETGHVRYNIFV
ncbi:MAG: flagellar hook-length control protein FliK [Alphaproteobacteria bacterium]|nr:flagellar hook-length control protein FliK [Alphaproteobacteria bacterium]